MKILDLKKKNTDVDIGNSDKTEETRKKANFATTMTDIAIKKLEDNQLALRKHKREVFWLTVLPIILIIAVIRLMAGPVIVVGNSMNPTYSNGQFVLASNADLVKEIKYGQVVVFKNEMTENSLFIKRVEGVPGDVVQIKDGKLYRNGEVVEEDYDAMEEAGIYENETTLQDDEYFVLGDNRNASTDSRFIGPINKEDIRYIVQK